MDHRNPPMDHAWIAGEVASLSSVIGVLLGVLPTVATLFAILWYGVMVYDRFWGNPPISNGDQHDGHSSRNDHHDDPPEVTG